MIRRILDLIEKHIAYVLPLITVVLVIMLVVSYMIPKKVIDTYKTNMTEQNGDSERILSLDEGHVIAYHMNTGSRPMMGIHVGIAKSGNTYDTAALICEVYTADGEKVSENGYLLSQGEDLQYAYIPFADYEKCSGDITIQFMYRSGSDAGVSAPGLLVNGTELTNAYIEVDGEKFDGNLKTMSVYTHDTYPLVYDLRILVAVFLAASMTVNYRDFSTKKRISGKKEMRQEQAEKETEKQTEKRAGGNS